MKTIKPYSWQKGAIARQSQILKTLKYCHNASDTGTGKTVCALQTVKELGLKALIIAPKNVHTAWRKTADLMNVALHDVINPERLQFPNPYYFKAQWHLGPVELVIMDEIHRGASGVKSKTTRIIAELKAYPIKVLTLSATVADSPLKLRCVGYLAGLHHFNTNSYMRWCLDHACFKMPGVRALKFHSGPRGQLAIKDIAQRLTPYMVRIDSDKVPGFPESNVVADLYDLAVHDLEEFNRTMSELDNKLKDTTVTNPLTEMLRARQRTEQLKVTVLIDLVMQAVDEGLAPVVFVNFRDTVVKLQCALDAKGITTRYIWGGQNTQNRDDNIDAFQRDEAQVMIATIAAGGVGISLHATKDSGLRNRTSFITPNFSASEFVQALGRIHRAGGHNVTQHIVLAAGTIEERIHDAIRGKLGRIETINDGDLI